MTPSADDRNVTGSVLAALFADGDAAAKAMIELRAQGFRRVEISEVAGRDADTPAVPAALDDVAGKAPAFFQEHDSGASSFVDELKALGFDERDAHDLVHGLVKGGAMVTADAGARPEGAASILERFSGDVRYARSENDIPVDPAVSPTHDESADAVIALRAERLAIEKQRVSHGEARIHKEVVTHIETIDVPVSREELVIEHVSVNDTPAVDGSIDPGETIRIPLSEERVHVNKTIESKGEVIIGKRQVADVAHVSETLREERVHVDDPSAPTQSSATEQS